MAWPPILVRYGEIGIKSRSVRIQFEKRLVDRIEEQLVARGVEAEVVRQQSRVVVRAADQERALDALRHTFGVVSASPTTQCPADPDKIAELVLEMMRERMGEGQSFAVRVKRAGTHTFTSIDVAKRAAARILDDLEARNPRVDLNAPDVEVHVEVRDADAYVFDRIIRGPGGLPLGSQGRVAVLVDSPRAAHAAWLMAKRGSGVYFWASDVARAEEWLRPLRPWVPMFRIREAQGDTRGEEYASLAPEVVEARCQAVVLADGLDEAMVGREQDALVGVPVFRPLVGYAGERYRDLCRAAELPEV